MDLRSRRYLEMPEFFEAHVTLLGDDDVVEHPDAEDRPGLDELPGDAEILCGGLERSRGVVVDQDDRGGTVGDRLGKDLPGVDEALVQDPDGDGPALDHLAGTVQRYTEEILLLLIPPLRDQREDV